MASKGAAVRGRPHTRLQTRSNEYGAAFPRHVNKVTQTLKDAARKSRQKKTATGWPKGKYHVAMKVSDQMSQPGLVIDLMTAALIVSIPILALSFYIAHIGWHRTAITAMSYAVSFLIVYGTRYLWRVRKHRRSHAE